MGARAFTKIVTTGSDGTYVDSYEPIEIGSWNVKVSWEGDTYTLIETG